jgi:methionyl-tRNA synthetase
MSTPGIYLSTTIPYISARPHLGHALEFVQADVPARHSGRPGTRSGCRAGPTTTR